MRHLLPRAEPVPQRTRTIGLTCLGAAFAVLSLRYFVSAETIVPEDAIALQCSELTESSGVAISRHAGDIVWTHNDSGDGPRLFAFQTDDGSLLAEATLNQVKAIDWEDMCSFERNGQAYLAVGDVGDNARRRKSVTVYVFPEPKLKRPTQLDNAEPNQNAERNQNVEPNQIEEIRVTEFLTIQLTYAHGPADCESLAYDPRRQELLLCTKEGLRSRLYRVPFDLEQTHQSVQAQAEQAVGLPLVTAADISSDGQYLIMATYGPACLVLRDEQDNWAIDANALTYLELPPRKQGESLCFSADNQRLLLTSEQSPTPLWNIPFKVDAPK